MDQDLMRRRLEWVAAAKLGAEFDRALWECDEFGCGWGPAMSATAQAALDAIPVWRPIDEAPIPGPDGLPEYWTFPCLLQTAAGIVGEGYARHVTDNRVRGRKHVRVLRWYMGSNIRPRDSYVCKDPRYFMPLPQPRKD